MYFRCVTMVSRNEDKVDFGKLEKELSDAVEADERYWRENDAKFRAVNQKVATYDEFRDIVLASHLKPLEKSDNIGQCFKQTWNANTSKAGIDTKAQSQQTDVQTKLIKVPSNAYEFSKVWKNGLKTPADRYSFLLHVRSWQLGKIFRYEISFGLLGEMISVLSSNYSEEDSIELVAMLEALSTANRFNLSLQFLDTAERSACSELLQQLHKTLVQKPDETSQQSAQTATRLMSLYNV